MDILNKIKEAGLVGRGGASFPVAQKWAAVLGAKADRKFVVCNVSEGEPGVKKDGYILEHYGEKVVDGIRLAMEFLSISANVKGCIYINHDYAEKFGDELSRLIAGSSIEIFVKPIEAGYIGGEESAALNVMEGKRAEPRLKPPFPGEKGLWLFPTLVNNVETFLNVSLVNSGEYKKIRYYTANGDCAKPGVFGLPEDHTIERVLRESGNYPDFPFFVQVGGNGSGEVLNDKQLDKAVGGAGSIAVYKLEKHKPKDLLSYWVGFFFAESCGQCTACREGTYRLKEILESAKPDWTIFIDLLDNLKETSFCALGSSVPIPIKTYLENILMPNEQADEEIKNLIEVYKMRNLK